MLSQINPVATIGVKDLGVAKKFYEEKLGFKPLPTEMPGEVQLYQCGHSKIEVYRSEYAGTNKATSLCWNVGENIMEEVQDLKTKGIVFEHYNFPDAEIKNDIHDFGEMKAAWFKDPDGNILGLTNQ